VPHPFAVSSRKGGKPPTFHLLSEFTYIRAPGAPSFRSLIAKGWETTNLRLLSEFTYIRAPGAPSFRSPIAKGWETTNLRLPFKSGVASLGGFAEHLLFPVHNE
jgi:hypothetical protein